MKNQIKEIRESQLMSKAELARKAGVSPVTVDRLENGAECRMSTKRKIILALGLKLTDRNAVFPGDEWLLVRCLLMIVVVRRAGPFQAVHFC